eukprot:2222235-Rhodomonas_salina.2
MSEGAECRVQGPGSRVQGPGCRMTGLRGGARVVEAGVFLRCADSWSVDNDCVGGPGWSADRDGSKADGRCAGRLASRLTSGGASEQDRSVPAAVA